MRPKKMRENRQALGTHADTEPLSNHGSVELPYSLSKDHIYQSTDKLGQSSG